MRIPRIYTSQPLQPDSEIDLESGASRHLLKVLRMASGRELILFNGDGHEYSAKIVKADKKVATVKTSQKTYRPNTSSLETEIAIGMSKGDRLEWVFQKATELGIHKITPLTTSRSEIKISNDRLEKKMASWEKIVIAASEQCQRNILPVIAHPKSLSEFLPDCQSDTKLVLHHRGHKGLSALSKPKSVSLLIGPEGGLSDDEISQANQFGFVPLTLGRRVLRTETAPVAALSIIQYLWGDLSLENN